MEGRRFLGPTPARISPDHACGGRVGASEAASRNQRARGSASISPDGKRLAFDTESEIWIAPIEGDAEHPRLGAATKFLDAATPIPEAQFSPDGRWIAYVSPEFGSSDVFVQPNPGTGGRWQISNGGGRFPIWSKNGHELLFLGPDHRIRAVEYTVDGYSFFPGRLRVWSETRVADLGVNSAYDLAPDGKRCAAILNADQAGESNRCREPEFPFAMTTSITQKSYPHWNRAPGCRIRPGSSRRCRTTTPILRTARTSTRSRRSP